MNQVQINVGDAVRITSGPYKDAEGVVEDLQPECDAVRIHTKDGSAYCFLDGAVRIPTPMKQVKEVRGVLQK